MADETRADQAASTRRLFGLVTASDQQMKLIDEHCFGDCGKMGLFHYMNSTFGPIAICTEEVCPHLNKQLDVPCGESEATGEPIYLRSIK